MSRQFRSLEDMARMAYRGTLTADPNAPATMTAREMWEFLAGVYQRHSDEPAARALAAHYVELTGRYESTLKDSVRPTYNAYDVFLRASVVAHAAALSIASPLDWWRHHFARKGAPWCRCYGLPAPLRMGRP